MEFRILGPLDVVEGDRQIPLGGRKPRALLAMLILRRRQIVAVDELVDALWGHEPPKTADHSVQVYVSELRKALGGSSDRPPIVVRRDPGYTLDAPDSAIDLHRFKGLRSRGRAALDESDAVRASELLGEALAVWRGAALADFTYDDFARGEIERLEELRVGTIEDRLDADLAHGRHGELVAELRALVEEHPSRERLRGDLMLALYRSGRQAEAVEVFHAGRALLGEEYGLDPGARLVELASAILASDPSLDLAPSAGGRSEPPSDHPATGEPTRKIVTTLAVDVSIGGLDGAPADPEAIAATVPQVTDEVRATLVARGATVLALDGTDVVAVFGHPNVHEDDAVRATAAADELTSQPPVVQGFDVRLSVGVHTGEIVAAPTEEISADVARDARRLAAIAGASGIVIDSATRALVRDAVETSAIDEGAFKVTRVEHGVRGVARHLDSVLVGRDAELADLNRAFDQARDERACRLVTVAGEAGIGKTRLADEFVRTLGLDGRVLIGRCLSFGEGITYWPIAEAIRAEAGIADGADADVARTAVRALVAGTEDGDRIADGLVDILGVGSAQLAEGEAFWSVRRLLEELAAERPTVLLVEDVHWAEPTLLDLLDGLVDWMRDSPLLVVCTARPDIYERRGGWGGRPGATTLSLRPLAREDVDRLIENLINHPTLDDDAKQRIAAAAEGNPLFVEQLLAMMIDDRLLTRDGDVWALAGDLGRVVLPTTVHALLAARLDRLPPDQRAVLGIASVVGRTFDPAGVSELLDEDVARTDAALRELVRKDLVRPERTPEGEAFRFRHVLIMQAAYEMLPKLRRAELHEAVADGLSASAAYDELAGDHLARAANALAEIGGDPERIAALRARAGPRFAAGAGRAFARGDMPAAASLYGAAASLFSVDDPDRLALLPNLASASVEIGRLEAGERIFDEAVARGTEQNEPGVVADALLFRFESEVWSGRVDAARRSVEIAEQLIPQAEANDDDFAQQRLWSILGMWAQTWHEQKTFTERALSFGERAGDTRGVHENIQMLSGLLHGGPTPVDEALEVVADYHRRTAGDRVMDAAIIVCAEASLLAMDGRMDESRQVYERARDTFRELQLSLWLAASGTIGPTSAELIGGDPARAEAMAREGIDGLERIDAGGNWLHENLRLLTLALVAQGKIDEAAAIVKRLERSSDWISSSAFCRADVLRAQGRPDEAIAGLRSHLEHLDENWVLSRGFGTFSLARALRDSGEEVEAVEVGQAALGIYERKGDVVTAATVRAFLDDAQRAD
ncbi:MAG: BTAD domain-containing putative transcriptional regulator [Chloroflexota bacterium]